MHVGRSALDCAVAGWGGFVGPGCRVFWVLLLLAGLHGPQVRAFGPPAGRPNVLIFLTDDQRYDEVDFMPFVVDELKKRGTVFVHAFVSNPVCCPVRASLLAGGFYSQKTGVLTNAAPNGGVWLFREDDTLATRLQRAGYRTALIGKYLNGYLSYAASRQNNIPPGWSDFYGTASNNWEQWQIVIGSTGPDVPGSAPLTWVREYPSRYFGRTARSLIGRYVREGRPFFMVVAFLAPHTPAIPSREDRDDEVYNEFATGGNFVYRGRGWGEADVSDKPLHIRQAAQGWWNGDPDYYPPGVEFLPGHRTPDDLVAHRIQSLLSVDREIRQTCELLEKLGILDETVIVFTSDHGYLLGEHRIFMKRYPYEEAIRVPLIIRAPGGVHRYVGHLVQMDLDLPNTVLDYAGLRPFRGTDGLSLRPLIEARPLRRWREWMYFESYAPPFVDWFAIRDFRWKYVEYATGERELYDLETDPYELENRASDESLATLVRELARRLAPLKGLHIRIPLSQFPEGNRRVMPLPDAYVGQPYRFQFKAEGGRPPYRWSIPRPQRVPGLTLDRQTGLLAGVPEQAFGYNFDLIVEDSSQSPVHGGPQRYVRRFRLVVRP